MAQKSTSAALDMNSSRIIHLATPRSGQYDAMNSKTFEELFMKYDTHNGNIKLQYPLNMQTYKIENISDSNNDNGVVLKKWITDHVTSQTSNLSPYLKKDGTIAITSNLDLNSKRIINLATPTLWVT